MATIVGRPTESVEPVPLLLRLYPAAWRARYGDEFAELLASRPPRLRDRLDILRGALDARLHPQVGRGAATEAPLPRDRAVGAVFVIAGALLTAWASIGVSIMRPWGSGDLTAPPQLQAAGSLSGMLGSILIAVAIMLVLSRYDWSIGSSGAVGGVLTAAGLVFASTGGGVVALILLGGGTALLTWRLRGRLVGTLPAVVLAGTTALLIGAFFAFAASGGQDLRLLWVMLAYGPAWMLVGVDLRVPSPRAQLIGA